jgi:hypothetical protein
MFSNQRAVFASSWWLDATAGEDSWGICEIKQNNEVVASMPWVLKHRFGLRIISQPQLTQTLGPWLSDAPIGTKYARRLAREKDLMEELIDQLPPYHFFSQSFAPEITNWLPFYWKGFQQTTRYTYRLTELSCQEQLWSGLQDKIRTDIRKAKKNGVTVERSSDIHAFLDVNEKTFERQGLRLPYSRSFIERLHNACQANNASTIFIARGADGAVHAANYIVWNDHCAYYLMGGGDPLLRNSGATSLAMWEAIMFSASISGIFDFEGSMIEPVERFIRGFGAIQTPYFAISHTNSRRLAAVKAARTVLQACKC